MKRYFLYSVAFAAALMVGFAACKKDKDQDKDKDDTETFIVINNQAEWNALSGSMFTANSTIDLKANVTSSNLWIPRAVNNLTIKGNGNTIYATLSLEWRVNDFYLTLNDVTIMGSGSGISSVNSNVNVAINTINNVTVKGVDARIETYYSVRHEASSGISFRSSGTLSLSCGAGVVKFIGGNGLSALLSNSDGMNVSAILTITGGNPLFQSGTNNNTSTGRGVYVSGDLSITNSSPQFIGLNDGVYCQGNMTVSGDSSLIAAGGINGIRVDRNFIIGGDPKGINLSAGTGYAIRCSGSFFNNTGISALVANGPKQIVYGN